MVMREIIYERFPPSYNKYIEVFGGAGWVLFHKQKEAWELYNDYDSRLHNLFCCVRDNPEEVIAVLDNFPINGRQEFHRLRQRMKDGAGSDIEQAADFFRIIRYSYGSKLRTYSAQPCDITTFYPIIRQAHHRLKTVVIENRDFESCIRQYDSPGTFFILTHPITERKIFMTPDLAKPTIGASGMSSEMCVVNGFSRITLATRSANYTPGSGRKSSAASTVFHLHMAAAGTSTAKY
jgi:DNA adenine methylase